VVGSPGPAPHIRTNLDERPADAAREIACHFIEVVMKKLFLIVLGLVVVVIGAALVIPFVVPTETYKQQITAQVERMTGRQLTIAGPLEFSILPSLSLTADNLQFANLPGAAEADMASLKELQVKLKLWPLLHGAVEVDRFILVQPEVHLEVDQQGRPNWQFGAVAPSAKPPAEAGGGGGGGGGAPGVPISEIKLGDIRVVDGTLTYSDASSGKSEKIEQINLSINLPDLQSRLAANGSLAYKGQTVKLDLGVEQPLHLIQGGSSPVTLTTDSDLLDVGFDGTLANGAAPTVEGSVKLDVASIRKLAVWLAQPIELPGEGLRTLAVTGQLKASPKQIGLTDVSIALDDIKAKGQLAADLSGALPNLTGRLDVGALDLNPYLPPETPGHGTQTPAGKGGWSDEPIALPPIGGANVAFDLTVASLTYRKFQLGQTALGLNLKNNTLTAELRELAAYGGQGKGSVQIALEGGAPVLREQLTLKGIQALPLLKAAADFDRLEGTLDAEIKTETSGKSQLALVQNLNGDGSLTLSDGAIVGVNIAAMVRNLATAFANPATAGEARKTDFAELGGTFTIRKGILKNDDMHLQAPVLRVTGRGEVDLPERTVNYRIEPEAAPTLEGQGSTQQVAGLMVPVIIEGPWDDLKYRPDLSGIVESALKDPEAFKKQIEQMGDQGKALKDALKNMEKKGGSDAAVNALSEALGGGQKNPPAGGGGSQGAAKPEEQVQKLLKGLFGN
jgi:AsmA protein